LSQGELDLAIVLRAALSNIIRHSPHVVIQDVSVAADWCLKMDLHWQTRQMFFIFLQTGDRKTMVGHHCPRKRLDSAIFPKTLHRSLFSDCEGSESPSTECLGTKIGPESKLEVAGEEVRTRRGSRRCPSGS
jgi:hypothetical protein